MYKKASSTFVVYVYYWRSKHKHVWNSTDRIQTHEYKHIYIYRNICILFHKIIEICWSSSSSSLWSLPSRVKQRSSSFFCTVIVYPIQKRLVQITVSLCNSFKSSMIFLLTMLNSSGISLSSTTPRETRRSGALTEPGALSVCGIRKYEALALSWQRDVWGIWWSDALIYEWYSSNSPVIFNKC